MLALPRSIWNSFRHGRGLLRNGRGMDTQGLKQRIHVWIYGDIVERWRTGKLNDRQFGNAYRRRARRLSLFMLGFFALAVIGDWLDHRDLSVVEHLPRVGDFALLFGVMWLGVAALFDGLARFVVANTLLNRDRGDALRQQREAPAIEAPYSSPHLEFGSYTRTTWFWNQVSLRAGALAALTAVLSLWTPRAQVLLAGAAFLLLLSLLARFDRRPYLDISPEGIWCRAWGKQRLPFHDFKAAYTRQDGIGEGIVLIPHTPAELAPKLSWEGRLALRNGERVPAHRGTLTIWTSRVGLDCDSTLQGIRAELSKRAR